jgi:hypothetical protein
VSYSDGTLYVSNTGNVPIYSLNIKTSTGTSHKTENIKDLVERHTEQGSLEMKDEFTPVEIGYTKEYSKL